MATEIDKRDAAMAIHDAAVDARRRTLAEAIAAYLHDAGVSVARAAAVFDRPEHEITRLLRERRRSDAETNAAPTPVPTNACMDTADGIDNASRRRADKRSERRRHTMTRTNASEARWPDTSRVAPPAGGCYQAAVWLLGRHPDLARLAARIHGVITHHNDAPTTTAPTSTVSTSTLTLTWSTSPTW